MENRDTILTEIRGMNPALVYILRNMSERLKDVLIENHEAMNEDEKEEFIMMNTSIGCAKRCIDDADGMIGRLLNGEARKGVHNLSPTIAPIIAEIQRERESKDTNAVHERITKVWYELSLCDSSGWWRVPRRYTCLEEVLKEKAGFGGKGRIIKVTESEVK